MRIMQPIRRFGYVCKWMCAPGGTKLTPAQSEQEQKHNVKLLVYSWMNRQTAQVVQDKLKFLAKHNLASIKQQMLTISKLESKFRMFRISSDIFPGYSDPKLGYFWKNPQIISMCAKQLAEAGQIAKAENIRLSMHPGQYCVLASDRPDVVEKSIAEFQYHADVARWMGYGRKFQDFKINIHIGGRLGPDGIRKTYARLSEVAKNTITVENEEFAWGLDDCLKVGDIIPVVLDIHHHWVRQGQYIQPDDPRVKAVIASWRGVRPTLHYSLSREDLLVKHRSDELPDMEALNEKGFTKSALRAHSDMMWNRAANRWAMSFSKDFDIMVQAKFKNLATFDFVDSVKNPQAKSVHQKISSKVVDNEQFLTQQKTPSKSKKSLVNKKLLNSTIESRQPSLADTEIETRSVASRVRKSVRPFKTTPKSQQLKSEILINETVHQDSLDEYSFSGTQTIAKRTRRSDVK